MKLQSLARVIKHAFEVLTSPGRLIAFLQRKFILIFFPKNYTAISTHRSASDNGDYVTTVENALKHPHVFVSFRRHPAYTQILEHVSYEHGAAYIEVLKRDAPDLFARVEEFKVNDLVGNPKLVSYAEVSNISTTTLRYMKVANDIRKYFGEHLNAIAEIGCGYGGQRLVLDKVIKTDKYHMFDLLPVLKLIERYLESHLLRGAYQICPINQHPGDVEYDLVISNYAFSELPLGVQMQYIHKIISKSKRGYLTMDANATSEHLTLDDLKKLLPPFKIYQEEPITWEGNYIIVWGENA